jgi:hypothetical protein
MTTTASLPTRGGLTARIDAVAAALADLAEEPAWSLTDATLDAQVAAAHRLASSAQELVARTAAEAVHAGEWQIRIGPDGLPEVIPPARVDPHRRPLRHARLKHRHRQRDRHRPRPGAG